ncbi:hypothetical protein SBOR_9063 [Sclerotinia borealis F-4128]|uniref:Uncharacterized protein n=1 Tax=Sclerotinia borealis (strain F-4128) TaxID=1432307 RepID=W9C3U4_SCLBF|nr:hypothetical protein SBOR_9063 [Sclerotinia borealis F-4128]
MSSFLNSQQPSRPHSPSSMSLPQIPSPIHTEQPKLINEMTISPISDTVVNLRGGGHHGHHSHGGREYVLAL